MTALAGCWQPGRCRPGDRLQDLLGRHV